MVTFDSSVDLVWVTFSEHTFLHSEVLYLGPREGGRTDADQMLCQILSKELENRSLGNHTAWAGLICWFAQQSSKDWWPEQISMYQVYSDRQWLLLLPHCRSAAKVNNVGDYTVLRSCLEVSHTGTKPKFQISWENIYLLPPSSLFSLWHNENCVSEHFLLFLKP